MCGQLSLKVTRQVNRKQSQAQRKFSTRKNKSSNQEKCNDACRPPMDNSRQQQTTLKLNKYPEKKNRIKNKTRGQGKIKGEQSTAAACGHPPHVRIKLFSELPRSFLRLGKWYWPHQKKMEKKKCQNCLAQPLIIRLLATTRGITRNHLRSVENINEFTECSAALSRFIFTLLPIGQLLKRWNGKLKRKETPKTQLLPSVTLTEQGQYAAAILISTLTL